MLHERYLPSEVCPSHLEKVVSQSPMSSWILQRIHESRRQAAVYQLHRKPRLQLCREDDETDDGCDTR